MSALAQKSETANRLRALENQIAAELIDDRAADAGLMHWRQGIIAGLRMAQEAGEEAYKAVGA